MKRRTSLILGLMLIAASPGPAAIADDQEPPDATLLGLELVEKDRRGEIYADPDVDWSQYTQIKLDTATVSFRRNWQRDQNRYHPHKVRNSDVEKIKTELAELFDEVFTEELTGNGGYTLAAESGDEVLHIVPKIVDLDVHAPDTMNVSARTTQFTETAGRMTLKLELYDSVTGDLIATASDRREAPRRGYVQWSTSVSNRAEARRMLQRWATDLRKRLDEARGA